MTLERMQAQLGLETIPGYFHELYIGIADSWRERKEIILSESFIEKTLSESFCLEPFRERIVEAATELKKNDALCLLVCLLEARISQKSSSVVTTGTSYIPPKGEGLAYDFLHLFPAIPTMPNSIAHLRSRGVPENVIADTMREYDYCVDFCRQRECRPQFDRGRLDWICRIIHNEMIRIGRLKYDLPGKYIKGVRVFRNEVGKTVILANHLQIHHSGRVLGSAGHKDIAGSFFAQITESEDAVTGHKVMDGIVESKLTTLSKKEWTLCLSEEDCVLRIHIPPDGSFDQKTVTASYALAREIFSRCYPDYPYKAFFCSSWLISSDLREILRPSSNILAFQKSYTRIPVQSTGVTVFPFVFQMPAAIPKNLNLLPETTSLQRKVKRLYINGGHINECAGFFF